MAELLAPAGNLEKLIYAVHYGADAVYLAGQRFGLRAHAGNFSDEDIAKGIAYAHERGVKVYVALNAYPHNAGLQGFESYTRQLEGFGVDAFIVADPGIYRLIQETGIKTPIHISTQATLVNWAAVQFWEAMPGVERVVLARELHLDEIAEIANRTELEIEVFVHGAMCMSYSGRCLLSNYMTGRDANQGACAQACRWSYALQEEARPGVYYPIEEDDAGTYIFNSQDLATLAHLPDLVKAGVDSFKIEGRMKSLFYVATTVRAYRAIMDLMDAGQLTDDALAYWQRELDRVSHRPYTSGFLYGRPEDHGIRQEAAGSDSPWTFIGSVVRYDQENGLALVEQRNKFSLGDRIQFFGPHYQEKDVTIEAMWSEEGEAIDQAPHPKQLVHIKLPFDVCTGDLIRRQDT